MSTYLLAVALLNAYLLGRLHESREWGWAALAGLTAAAATWAVTA